LVTLKEGSCYIDDYPLEQGSDLVLMHTALTGCTGVEAPTSLFNFVPCQKPVVPLSAFEVLGNKIISFQALNPAGYFSFKVLKIHESGQQRVVGAQV
jgi:hypothetical protein